jgi:hypothetical protein
MRGVRRRLAAAFASVPGPIARVAASRDSRAPTSARGGQSITPSTPPFDLGRPDAVGVALASLARLAVRCTHREAGDRRRLAPTRLSPLLDLEKPRARRTTERTGGCARVDPRAIDREPPLGCASDPRRTAEAGNFRQSVDCRQVNPTASAPAVTDVAGLPRQPQEPGDGRRPVRRADSDVPATVRTGHPRARPSTDRDGTFAAVATTVAGMNIQAIRTAPRSPWQNAYVERVIGSIRRDCLDHVIVASEAGLRRVLSDYIAYYMRFARISRWRRTARCLDPSNRHCSAASWRRRKWAAFITATIASRRR